MWQLRSIYAYPSYQFQKHKCYLILVHHTLSFQRGSGCPLIGSTQPMPGQHTISIHQWKVKTSQQVTGFPGQTVIHVVQDYSFSWELLSRGNNTCAQYTNIFSPFPYPPFIHHVNSALKWKLNLTPCVALLGKYSLQPWCINIWTSSSESLFN